MKNMIEYMTTMIVTMIIIFMFSSVISIGTQMLNARLIFGIALENIEASYYNYNPNNLLKDDMFDGWNFKVEELNSINSRKDYLVSLNYKINIPLIGTSLDNLKIEGYAR